MLRIVVLNPKGGSGKTTIAVNLASHYAVQRERVVLMDQDPQGSTTRWFRKRGPGAYAMDGVAAYERDARTTRTFRLRVPAGSISVVCARKPSSSPACWAAPNTALSPASTSGVLRRV